jgi:hypothetical protein
LRPSATSFVTFCRQPATSVDAADDAEPALRGAACANRTI